MLPESERIRELCEQIGRPDLADRFISEGRSLREVEGLLRAGDPSSAFHDRRTPEDDLTTR